MDEEVQQLDLDQLKYLTDADKARYMRLEQLFKQAGWADVLEMCQSQAVAAHNRAANSTSWEQNRLNVGLRDAYTLVASLERATHAEYTELADSNRQKVMETILSDELQNQT